MDDNVKLHSECGVGSVENGRDVRTVGGAIKFFPDKILGRGSNGTIVYEGEYVTEENLCEPLKSIFSPAAVKCLSRAQYDIKKKGLHNHYDTAYFPSINRYYRLKTDKGFVFIAMGLCDDDLGHLVQKDEVYAGLFNKNGCASPRLLQLMRDIVSGLVNLHSLGIIHGDLQPSHVLISGDRARLSGMGSSRRLVGDNSSLGLDATISGTVGWRSPEQILNWPQTLAIDMFNLGCVLFFIFTKGKHPFGDLSEQEINSNVRNPSQVANIVNLLLVAHTPAVVKDLLSRLLKSRPELRPTASEVLAHPLFWNNMRRVQFLIRVRWRIEFTDETSISIAEALESKAHLVFSETTFENDPLINAMLQYISPTNPLPTVQDLLRVIEKTLSMAMREELPNTFQELVGHIPTWLDNYIGSRFPKLLTVVYGVIFLHCRNEETFSFLYVDDDEDPLIVHDVGPPEKPLKRKRKRKRAHKGG